jgi:hypothetical protein
MKLFGVQFMFVPEEVRKTCDRYGEQVIGAMLGGGFNPSTADLQAIYQSEIRRQDARDWLTERNSIKEYRERWIPLRDLILELVIIGLIAWEIYEGKSQADILRQMQTSAETTAKAVQESFKTAVTQFRLDQRAWLGFSFGTYKYTVGQPLDTPYQIADTGKTPALNVRGMVVTHFMRKGDTPTFNYNHRTEIRLGTILPGVSESGTSYLLPSDAPNGIHADPMKFSMQMYRQLSNGSGYLIVYGKIEYDSVFGAHHWMRFCRTSGPTAFTDECVDYNGVDSEEEPSKRRL